MDFTKQRAAPTGTLHLRGLDNRPLYSPDENGRDDLSKPARIVFYSPGSPQQAQMEERATQRALERLEKNEGRPNPPSPDVRRREAAEDLALMTHSFENIEYPPAGGAQGIALFEAFYGDAELGHIASQASRFIANWGNFKPGSATS